MGNPLSEKVNELEGRMGHLNPKDILISIKDFCDACVLNNSKCSLCFLNEWKIQSQNITTK